MGDTVTRHLLPRNAAAKVVRPCKRSGTPPSVSVVIPCFNYGRYLPQCVDSVLNQQEVCIDVLIIDDASSDGSDQIVRKLGAQDTRIRTICHTANQGVIATCKEGIAHIRGDYTLLLSADDLLTPGSLVRATSLMQRYPSVGITYGSAIDFTDESIPAPRTGMKRWVIWRGHDWIAQLCRSGENVISACGVLIRTSVLRRIDAFGGNLIHTADFDLWMQIAVASDVGYIAGADQGLRRMHNQNLHHSFSELDDLSQRLASFDNILNEGARWLRDPDSLREAAHRALARSALRQAIRDTAYRAIPQSALRRVIKAYAHGSPGDKSAADYSAFALKAWPDAPKLREWRTLHNISRPASPPKLDPSLVAWIASRKLRIRFQNWRRKLCGV